MARDAWGNSIVIAAIILGLAVLGGSFVIKSSVDQWAQELQATLTELEANLDKLAASGPQRPSATRPSRSRGPDPDKHYTVAVGDAPTEGPDTAPIKIVEWSDFQCPFCGRVRSTLEQIREEYGDKVQIAFKHWPIPSHTKARPAHQAAEAARLQGKFWEMHDKIYGDQRNMSPQQYLKYAEELGLNVEKFEKDLNSSAVEKRLDDDTAEATKLGLRGTPAFFINGRFLSGAQPLASFKKLIDEELAKN